MGLLRNGEKLHCRRDAIIEHYHSGNYHEVVKAYLGPEEFGGYLKIEMALKSDINEIVRLQGVVELKAGQTFRTLLAEYEGI